MILGILKSFIRFAIMTFICGPGVMIARKEKVTRKDIIRWFLSITAFFAVDYIWTIAAYMITGAWLMPWDALGLITGSFILKTLLRMSVYILMMGLCLVFIVITVIHTDRKFMKDLGVKGYGKRR